MTAKKKHPVPPRLAPGSSLVDTHCHLDMTPYRDDLNEVVERAGQGGVHAIITVGIDVESSKKAIALSERFPGVHATVGIHPHNSGSIHEKDYDAIRELARHPRVVAYGEIGMDLAKMYAAIPDQREHCQRQVRLGRELGLPLIIHDREAHDAILEVLREEGPFPAGGVMHCFSGDLEFARKVVDLGFFISIPGIVTFPSAKDLREVAARISLDRLILETDGPYLAPIPMRGRRNEPLYLLHTARMVAELKGLPIDEVARVTTENCRRLFGIEIPG